MFLTKETITIFIQRLWQSVAGVITVILIAYYLSPVYQGWYYTFIGFTSLYSIFEMGLGSALIHVAAQLYGEYFISNKNLDRAKALSSTLQPILRSSFKVYQVIALAYISVVLPIGWYVFSLRDSNVLEGEWKFPWVLIIVATAANMTMTPFLAIVEGVGKICEVYLIRLIQGIAGAVTCWILIICGEFLLAAAMMPLASFIISILWIICFQPKLLKNLFTHFDLPRFDWAEIVWPIQWRAGISWVSVYCLSQLATPILFIFSTPIVAGQMGLSLAVAHMLGILAHTWMARGIPKMTVLAKNYQCKLLDLAFINDLKWMIVIYISGATVMLIIYNTFIQSFYAERFLPFYQFFGLLVFVLFFHVSLALSTYLRFFKKEPLMLLYFLGAVINTFGGVLVATDYSSAGIISTMLFSQIIVIFPCSIIAWKRLKNTNVLINNP